MSKCECKPNMYCVLKDQSCSSCARHRLCKAGYGVSKPGTSRKFSFIMKIRDKSSKSVLDFLRNGFLRCEMQAVSRRDVLWQGLQHRPLSAASKVTGGPRMHWLKTKLLQQLKSRAASFSLCVCPDAVEGLLKWAMPLRTLCVNLGSLSRICNIQPQQKWFQPQAWSWSWALTQRRLLQTQRPPSAFLLQRGFLTTPQQGQWWAWSLTGI